MDEIVIHRWTKYGHDRGYAETASGTKLGWVDLKSGEVHLEAVPDASTAFDALASYRRAMIARTLTRELEPTPAEVENEVRHSAPAPSPGQGQESPTYSDLATHEPGKGVRQRATEEWVAAGSRGPVASSVLGFLGFHHEEISWRKGAEGEEAIGGILNDLHPHGWGILHSVPVGTRGTDIDHVLIGPPGVFTVNTKYHRDARITVYERTLYVNGSQQDYIRKSRDEAARASRLLTRALGRPVHAMGCLIISTGRWGPAMTIKARPSEVVVLGRREIPRWFLERPKDLAPEEVNAIYDVARRSTTWA